MNPSPGVFSEGEGEVVIGNSNGRPIIMYSPIAVAQKFEERARDNRKGKLAMQSADQVEKLTKSLNSMGEKIAFLEEQLAKSSEKEAIRRQFEQKK